MVPWAGLNGRLLLRGGVGGAIAILGSSAYFSVPSCESDSNSPPIVSRPSSLSYDFLIAGAGVSASAALKGLVERGSSSDKILLVSPTVADDASLADALAKRETDKTSGFMHRFGNASARLKTRAGPSVELLIGRRVDHVDASRKTVQLDDNTSISFGKLLLATGGDVEGVQEAISKNCVAPDGQPFVCFAANSSSKVDALIGMPHAAGAEPPHATVVGGSWASATMGASLLARGACVSFSFAEPHFLARHLPKFASTDIVQRMKHIAREFDVNVDTLSYSALKYIACSEVPLEYRRNTSNPIEVEKEAVVHMSLVFDAFDLVQFRSDLVIFAPTSLPFPHKLLRSLRTDDAGKLISTPELSVSSDIFAAGACLADVVDSPATWSSRRAVETGAHAARNMLGAREPFDAPIPKFDVDLSPLGLRLLCIGTQDGNCQTRGFFLVSRERSSTTYGGHLVDGVIFYLSPVRQDMCEVLGMCIWSSDSGLAKENAFAKAEGFLTNSDGFAGGAWISASFWMKWIHLQGRFLG